ncbi:MAG: hypothetical protein JO061_10335, partial [Acidobacteriaceae bacterium]|nr:hypothetical protein [Acidobacteriaceae bacterium]
IISGSTDGGIYKSTDAGEHWRKLDNGLPSGLFGRSNVAISASRPERIYALIEAKPGAGLYRSEDGGATWTLINGSGNIITQPFYYPTLGVDPNNADIVWVGDEGWYKSTDGGKTFHPSPVPHGDNHDVWINPKNSNYMIQANDGGANISLDGGRTWSTQANQPTAEIYQVAIDNQFPYRVYGAQQDNTTVIAPSLPLGNGQDFRVGPGCETGPIIPDNTDPQIVYGGCKGQFSVQDMNTNDEKQYWVGAESLYGNGGGTLIYRFQRVAPMEVSPNEPHTAYYGSQYLHRTRDFGVSWDKISPDLTANPPEGRGASGEPITRDATGEEVYSTLYAIRESPIQKGLIWTGSNDGLVYVTQDDGKTWANVTPPGLAPGGRVQNIEPSPHRPGTAYVAIYRYLLGDFAPYIYRTDNFGKNWTRLTDGTNGIAKDEPTRVVREDPERAGLLYAGTEFGIYISFDNGVEWQPFQLNLPVTPITDIKLAHGDLILSTQGRSFWILDDLAPVRQVSEKLTTAEAILFKPRDAVRMPARGAIPGLSRNAPYPQYPQVGAMIDYYLSKAPDGDIQLEILDSSGRTVRAFSSAAASPSAREPEAQPADEEEGGFRFRAAPVRLDKTPGMHRFTWDLRYPGPWQSASRPEGPNGPVAVPGTYSVKLTVGSWTSTQPLHLLEDPRITKSGVTTDDLEAQFDHNMRVRDLVSEVNKTVAGVKGVLAEAKSGRAHLDATQVSALNDIAARLITPSIRYSQPELQTHITYLYGMTNMADQKIGRDGVERYEVLKKQLGEIEAELKKILPPTSESQFLAR